MNFIFVFPTDRLGGAERVAMNLIRLLASFEGNYIYIYFLSLDESSCWDELKTKDNILFKYAYSNSVKFGFIKFIRFITTLNVDVDFVYSTHAHVNSPLCLLRRLSILKCKNLIIRESSILSTRFSGLKKKLIDYIYLPYGNQDLLICQTSLMQEKLLEHRGSRVSRNSYVIPNPLDFDLIENKSKSSFFNDEYKSFKIVMVGRLVEIKNHRLVIESLSKLDLDYNLFIVGDGPLKENLQSLCDSLNLKDKVTFVGNVSNPYKYMKDAELGIISSFSEGFPNVLIEMMASGTKDIIITPCTGDLEKIPNITIAKDFSVEEMTSSIFRKIKQPLDNTKAYYEYACSRDVDSYWNKIEELLKVK
ncbi:MULTISPECIES: glycosyltransferase [unclassified Vibrio]|uniref:glycosyltransferase n=1 Tax=Vibrio TaxID=662 RepID=UPI00148287C2|nr:MULTISPECIES: glycosyltransferase [unclassified Vibrio]NNN41954.1 glycosyltransferase [Vibrio sp. 2-2(2)]NNO05048.1 glycosyltransferase [Vibrio sp. 7-5(1-a)]HCE2681115.1 glycosyltransferase [Vibrio parahaemolyticus]